MNNFSLTKIVVDFVNTHARRMAHSLLYTLDNARANTPNTNHPTELYTQLYMMLGCFTCIKQCNPYVHILNVYTCYQDTKTRTK